MEKKPIASISECLTDDGAFLLSTTINFNDKVVMYDRGVVKTVVIDDEEFTSRELTNPYRIVELDKKTGKRRVYKVVLAYEDELESEFGNVYDNIYEQVDVNTRGEIVLYEDGK